MPSRLYRRLQELHHVSSADRTSYASACGALSLMPGPLDLDHLHQGHPCTAPHAQERQNDERDQHGTLLAGAAAVLRETGEPTKEARHVPDRASPAAVNGKPAGSPGLQESPPTPSVTVEHDTPKRGAGHTGVLRSHSNSYPQAPRRPQFASGGSGGGSSCPFQRTARGS